MDRRSIEKRLSAYLKANRLKSTSQRGAIIAAFLGFKGRHVTIEELLESVRGKVPRLGYATVYRTLMLLVRAGIASQRHFGEGPSRFELAFGAHHDHLICTRCGRIFEFENEMIEKLQKKIARRFGFKLTGHKMELYGVCDGIRARGACGCE